MHTPAAMHRSGALKSWLTRSAIAAVLALSPAEVDAKPEAVVRGVVTSAPAPALVIQDGVTCPHEWNQFLSPG
jgi:hypothetical protein